MSEIVKKLRELGKANSIDMSGRQTIAECLNAFGGEDRREITKALNGAIKPVATPILVFSSLGSENLDPTAVKIDWYPGATSIDFSGTLHNGYSAVKSFKNDCKATLSGSGVYKLTTDLPASGTNKGFLICDASDNSVLGYANANQDGTIMFFGGDDVNVYLKLDIDGPLTFGSKTTYSFSLTQIE